MAVHDSETDPDAVNHPEPPPKLSAILSAAQAGTVHLPFEEDQLPHVWIRRAIWNSLVAGIEKLMMLLNYALHA